MQLILHGMHRMELPSRSALRALNEAHAEHVAASYEKLRAQVHQPPAPAHFLSHHLIKQQQRANSFMALPDPGYMRG
jgi:hypothetical protein